MQWKQGGCHCQRIRFEVLLSDSIEVVHCNCSICRMSGFLHVIVPASHFRLFSSNEQHTEYRFNTHTARHLFCSTCGIKPYYIPRSNPDGFDINFHCLDAPPNINSTIEFDGKNWEQHAHTLAHKSKEHQ